MKTIREYAEEYLQRMSQATQRIVNKNIIEPFGDRYFDESFYNDMMERLRIRKEGIIGNCYYTGIEIDCEKPQEIKYVNFLDEDGGVNDLYQDSQMRYRRIRGREGIGRYIFFRFLDDNGEPISRHEPCFDTFYKVQWKMVVRISKEAWGIKLLEDGSEYISKKREEIEERFHKELEELKEKTLERTRDIYEKKRALYLEDKRKKEEERKRKEDEERAKQEAYDKMQARAKAVIDSLNTIFAEVNAIERDCKDVPDGAWDEQLPKWHKVVTAKAREIAALSITHERLKDQAEYFASLDGEWQMEAESDEEISF